MAGATQLRVRRTMLDAGGYWRPLAALARLLEELGELAELTATPAPDADALASELADLWIITTALADQFLGEVPEPGAAPAAKPAGAAQHGSTAALLPAAGEIARVVNYYDGPKTPREASALPSLAAAVAVFHQKLGALASALEVDLSRAVTSKLDEINASPDMHRFARERSDPSTAPVLDRLRAAHPDTELLRLWGAPEAGPDTIAHALRSFAKACRAERLDAFAIEPAALDGLELDQLGLTSEPRGAFVLLSTALRVRPPSRASPNRVRR